jgi:hypothetical protein
MVWVERDAQGQVSGISREARPGFEEELADDHPAVVAFVAGLEQRELAQTDLEFVRVLEDLLEVLMEKNVLLFTELPEQAQAKILRRRAMRRGGDSLDLLDGDLPI